MVCLGIAVPHLAREVAEMVDHHRLAVGDPPGDPQRVRQHDLAVERDLAVGLVDLDAFEAGDEVVVPVGAAVLAVGRRAQPDRLLAGDGGGDASVLHLG